MCSPTRLVGGPNPDGKYLLAMIRGDRAYRVTGTRGTTAYLGLQVLAGTGMTPRRMAAYVSDTDLKLERRTVRAGVLGRRPQPADLDGAQWVQIPDDATSIVVREYVADADHRAVRDAAHRCRSTRSPPQPLTDDEAGRTVHRDGVDAS